MIWQHSLQRIVPNHIVMKQRSECVQTVDILPHLGLRPPLAREGGGFLKSGSV